MLSERTKTGHRFTVFQHNFSLLHQTQLQSQGSSLNEWQPKPHSLATDFAH